jgi:hypothetical protein
VLYSTLSAHFVSLPFSSIHLLTIYEQYTVLNSFVPVAVPDVVLEVAFKYHATDELETTLPTSHTVSACTLVPNTIIAVPNLQI